VKLGRLFVHVEIVYEMQLPGRYVRIQTCKFFHGYMHFQPHTTVACNYMHIWVHEWRNACRILFRYDEHVIEQQDCMGIRVGGGLECVGRVGNFLLEWWSRGISRKVGEFGAENVKDAGQAGVGCIG
jgi:hypothetical protein